MHVWLAKLYGKKRTLNERYMTSNGKEVHEIWSCHANDTTFHLLADRFGANDNSKSMHAIFKRKIRNYPKWAIEAGLFQAKLLQTIKRHRVVVCIHEWVRGQRCQRRKSRLVDWRVRARCDFVFKTWASSTMRRGFVHRSGILNSNDTGDSRMYEQQWQQSS